VESETSLVGTESRVELDSETPVDGNGSVISLPGNPEVDDSLGDLNNLKSSSVLGVLDEERFKSRGDLVDRLNISDRFENVALLVSPAGTRARKVGWTLYVFI
jgi:hypothetical protein